MAKKAATKPEPERVSPNPLAENAARMSLDKALVALQKSFSRVNAASMKNMEDRPLDPTALIVGNVAFEATVRLSPSKVEEDRLEVAKDGELEVKFNGTIHPDFRFVEKSNVK